MILPVEDLGTTSLFIVSTILKKLNTIKVFGLLSYINNILLCSESIHRKEKFLILRVGYNNFFVRKNRNCFFIVN